ncbi:MAG: hypothetical protein GY926_24955, partial [bacterium]|nr:hypothetical protein [bacterium]
MWRRVAILAVLGAIGAAIWRWLTGYQLLEQGASYTIRELRPLHRYPTYAQDVNNNGQVVGYAIIGDNEHETAGFVWDEDAGFQTLWTGWVVQDHWTQAVAINDNGQVVGHCLLGGKAHACIWDLSDGTFEIVHSLLEESCRAVDINNDGQVVGYIGDGFETNPFLWDAIGGVQALEPLASDGPLYSRPFAINETGEAVGHWFVPPNGSDHL